MKLSFLTLPFLVFLLLSKAQDCNNPLLEVFNLEALQDPIDGSNHAFCDNLQNNGQTCCSADTVQNFQNRLNSLTDSLQALAGERDVYITEIFANFTHQFQEIADDLSDFDGTVRRIQRENSSVGYALGSQASFLHRLDRELDNIDDNFTRTYRDYQEKRQTCFTTLLQIQANAWCLACDANYADYIDENDHVNAAPDVCTTIQESCTPFLLRSDYMNPIYQAQQTFGRLQSILTYLRDYRRNNFTLPDTQIIDDQWTESNPARRTSSLPSNCNETSCEWLCSNLFSSQFVLNQEIAGNGAGVIGGQDVRFAPIPLIIPPSRRSSRLLQAVSGWNPGLSSSGLTFDVIRDPGNALDLLPPNDNTDDTDDYITDNSDTDGQDPDWTDRTDNDPTDNDPTDNDPTDRTDNDPPTDRTDNDPTDRTDNDPNDRTDNDPTDRTDNDPTDRTDNDRTDWSDGRNLQNDSSDSDPSDSTDSETSDSDAPRSRNRIVGQRLKATMGKI